MATDTFSSQANTLFKLGLEKETEKLFSRFSGEESKISQDQSRMEIC